MRRDLAQVSTLAELDDQLGRLDPTLEIVAGGERIKRGHTNGPIRVSLPDGFLPGDGCGDEGSAYVVPDDADVVTLSGG